MKVLLAGIYNKALTGTNDFKTANGSRFYHAIAPQNATFPYATYFVVTDTYTPYLGADHEVFSVQFSIYSQNTTSSEIGDITGYLTALFDYSSLTVTGYTCMEVKRINSTLDYFFEDTVWMATVEYQIWIKKS